MKCVLLIFTEVSKVIIYYNITLASAIIHLIITTGVFIDFFVVLLFLGKSGIIIKEKV